MAGAVRQGRERRPQRGTAPGAFGLLALLLACAALAFVLWGLSGLPRAPDAERIREVLSGPELAATDAAAAAAALAWLVLLYLALSVGLRLALLLAERLSGGARWARAGLRLSALVTIPAVRRAVDSGVGGALLAASWLPLPASAGEESGPAYVATAAAAQHAARADAYPPGAAANAAEAPCLLYTVAPGEGLWEIARRCYGDGSRFVEIASASRGLPGGVGAAPGDPLLVRPGQVLRVPLPAENLGARDGHMTYRVRRGDHLWGIAERFLGDGFRWVEIWERNRGREMGDGSRLTDPDRLVPGWVLELPLPEPEAAPPGGAEDAAAPGPGSPGSADPGPPRAAPGAAAAETGAGSAEWPWPPHTAFLSAAGVAVLGGAALVVGRRRRHPGPAAGSGDAGRVALAAGALEQALSEAGFPAARPLLLREGGRRIEATVACRPGDAEALSVLRYDLGRRLGCELGAAVEDPARVALTIPGSGRFPGLLDGGPGARAALALPVGATADDAVYLNLEAAGSVTVAGGASEQRALLRSWLRTLSTLRAPDALSVRAEAGAAALLGEEAGLPHVAGGAGSEPAELADELDEVIASREGRAGRPLVAIFSLDDAAAELPAAAMREGPRAGVYVIRCLPPGVDGGSLGDSGAVVSLGGEGAQAEGDGASRPPGGIALRVGRERPLLLEPVLVRRDASPRWRESADPAGVHAPPRPKPEGPVDAARPPDPPEDGDEIAAGPGHGAGVPDTDADARVAESAAAQPSPVLAGVPLGPEERDARGADADPAPLGEPGSGDGSARPRARAGPAGRAPADEDADARGRGVRGVPASAEIAIPARGAAAGGDGAVLAKGLAAQPVPETVQAPGRQGALLTHAHLAEADGEAGHGAAPPFTVRCLGSFELRLDGAPLTAWPREKSRELLALLATYGGTSVPRETIAEALWPDYPADASLRHMVWNALSGLRRTLRSAASDDALQPVVTAGQRHQLQAALFRVDIDDFDAALRRAGELTGEASLAEYERAAALYVGDLLEHEFYPWAESYRRDYRQRLLDGASRAAAIAERLGDAQRAARFYRVILEREPTDEAAACGLMRQLARAGHAHDARRVYRELTAALRAELDDPGARPSPATAALLDELTAGAGDAPA